jgi:hypothetical protein
VNSEKEEVPEKVKEEEVSEDTELEDHEIRLDVSINFKD